MMHCLARKPGDPVCRESPHSIIMNMYRISIGMAHANTMALNIGQGPQRLRLYMWMQTGLQLPASSRCCDNCHYQFQLLQNMPPTHLMLLTTLRTAYHIHQSQLLYYSASR